MNIISILHTVIKGVSVSLLYIFIFVSNVHASQYIVGVMQVDLYGEIVSFTCVEHKECSSKLPITTGENGLVYVDVVVNIDPEQASIQFKIGSENLYTGDAYGGDKPYTNLYFDVNDRAKKSISLFMPPFLHHPVNKIMQSPVQIVSHIRVANIEIAISPK